MNMKSGQKIAALAVLCVAQLGAATSSIVRHESILRSGVPYRIRAAPVDPADAFRGRYVVSHRQSCSRSLLRRRPSGSCN